MYKAFTQDIILSNIYEYIRPGYKTEKNREYFVNHYADDGFQLDASIFGLNILIHSNVQINLDECYADENKIYQIAYKYQDTELIFMIDDQKTEILPDGSHKVICGTGYGKIYKNTSLSKLFMLILNISIIYIFIALIILLST
jgi:hypothetical protein